MFVQSSHGGWRSRKNGVDGAMEEGLVNLGGSSAHLWRHANEAYKVNARGEWLQNMLDGTRDPITGQYNGKKILAKLNDVKREESLPGLFPPETIAQMKEFANALNSVQSGNDPSPRSMAHMLLHRGGATVVQMGAGAGAYSVTHSPAIAITTALTPTALGLVLQSPRASKWLTLGYTLPASSKVSVDALGRLVGVLRAEGLLDDEGTPQGSGAPATAATPQPQ